MSNDHLSLSGIENYGNSVISYEANEYVGRLLSVGNVFRIFEAPFANVNFPSGHKFSIRGFFMHSIGQKYQFFLPTTIAKQYWTVSSEVSNVYILYLYLTGFVDRIPVWCSWNVLWT